MATLISRRILSPGWSLSLRRPLFVGATLSAKAKVAQMDPVQQLFLDKLKEFRDRSKGGKMPDLTPEAEKQYQDDLERLKRVYGGGDMSLFPKFTFEEK